METHLIYPKPLPLPATVEELMLDRCVKHVPTLNDHVESIYLALYHDDEFKGYLFGYHNSNSVTGKIALDTFKAALMICDHAKEHDIICVAKAKEGDIVTALNVVLRRYKKSRLERAENARLAKLAA